jgi:hypothetical protein
MGRAERASGKVSMHEAVEAVRGLYRSPSRRQ